MIRALVVAAIMLVAASLEASAQESDNIWRSRHFL